MTPLELLDDHARRPRNIGKLLNASAVGDVGSIVAGDALRFYLKVEGQAPAERVAGVRFQVFNCQAQLGPSSALTELVMGRGLAEAAELTAGDICSHLGGLDHLELPPRIWALDGLRAALATWEGRELAGDSDVEHPQLCRCLGIPEETVRQAISVRLLASIDSVVAATTAGSRCGSCRVDIAVLLDAQASAQKPEAVAAVALNRMQLMARIRSCAGQALESVRSQGGDLELWDLQGTVLTVRLRGTLQADAALAGQAMAALDAALKSVVDPTLSVVA